MCYGLPPKRYTSYLRDANESDEAMHRRYNRWWGRFNQPDPDDGSYDLADPQSLNRYSYVQNDPVNFVDPMGLNPVSPGTTFSSGILWTILYGNNADGFRMVHQWFEPYPGSGGEGDGTQNPAPNVDDIRNRVANMVGNSKCADFITKLINGAAALTGNAAVATDALKLFDAIRGQGGIVYKDNTATFGFQASTISGSISGGNAQILLAPPYPNPSGSRGFAESQSRIGATAALHETLHLAGKNGSYLDETFAAVVKGMSGQLPPRGDITKVRPASDYWGAALAAACRPR